MAFSFIANYYCPLNITHRSQHAENGVLGDFFVATSPYRRFHSSAGGDSAASASMILRSASGWLKKVSKFR